MTTLSKGRLCHSYWLCNHLCTKWTQPGGAGKERKGLLGKEHECIPTVSVGSLAA